MNEILAILILAIVQGVTEWIPVSSSGHLVLIQNIIGYEGGLILGVALHFGTLLAIFVYFSKDIVDIIEAILKRQWKSENAKIGLYLVIATIPVGIIGFLMGDILEGATSNLFLLSLGWLVTSLILFIGSIDTCKKNMGFKELGFMGALLIGFAQIFALMRGISRSGSTIVSGLLLGLSEKNAVKFSFLLSIPVILGANLLEIGNSTLPTTYLWAVLVSFTIGILTIHMSFTYILNNRKNFRWIALYVLILGLSTLIYSLFW